MTRSLALLCLLSLLLLLHTTNASTIAGRQLQQSTAVSLTRKEAYVSLLYGTGYTLAVRVMFQSLRASGATREMMVLVTPDVPERIREILKGDGIRVVQIAQVANPYAGQPKYQDRFSLVMSKLSIWTLEEYDKIVFLDADIQIFKNPDVLFKCGKFCVAFINPCWFNSGVMVVTPSKAEFEGMEAKMGELASYDGGDQGFLNSYFNNMLKMPLFDPDEADGTDETPRRLPFGFHLDHTLWYVRYRWELPESCKGRYIMEFLGLSQLKPWYWWSYSLMDLSWDWHAHRIVLPGTPLFGLNFYEWCLVFLPIAMVFVLYSSSERIVRTVYASLPVAIIPPHLFLMSSMGIGLVCTLLSGGLIFLLIPYTMFPIGAFFAFGGSTIILLMLTFGFYLVYCYKTGKNTTNRSISPRGGAEVVSPLLESLVWPVIFGVYLAFFVYSMTQTVLFAEVKSKIVYLVLNIFGTLFAIVICFARLSFKWQEYGAASAHLREEDGYELARR